MKKRDRVSEGEYRDLMPVEEVVDCFQAFYRGAEKPVWLVWRMIEI